MNLAPTEEQIEANNQAREAIYKEQSEMSKQAETVTITRAEYETLKEASHFLGCLRAAGVDNWEGYSIACQEADE